MLTPDDRELLRKRKRGLKNLDTAEWLAPLIWAGACLLTVLRFPLLNNPWALHARLSERSLDRASLESLASMAPILTILLQLLVIAFIWMGIRLLKRERRLIELVEKHAGREADANP